MRVAGHPEPQSLAIRPVWIPAYAGMTSKTSVRNERLDYRKLAQNRWMRVQASVNASVLVA
jgi:hypothetical protein